MVAARTASFTPEVGFALSHGSSSSLPESPTPATGESGKIPSAVSKTHAVQSPRGASEKIFAPHLRQTLITLIIARDSACVLILYCVEFCPALCANHGNQITQLVFDIAGSRNGIGNFLAQQRLIALPKSMKGLRDSVLGHSKLGRNVRLRRRPRLVCQQLIERIEQRRVTSLTVSIL